MSIYPNVRCTTCNGQVYLEDGDVICLLCNRTQEGGIALAIKAQAAQAEQKRRQARRHPRIGAPGPVGDHRTQGVPGAAFSR